MLRLWVRILPGPWMSVCCDCCVLSDRGLWDELITSPEESYRLYVVSECDLETSWMRRSWPTGGCRAKNKHLHFWLQNSTINCNAVPLHFHLVPRHIWGIYFIVGRTCLFAVDTRPCPLLSAIVSQLIQPLVLFKFLAVNFASALWADDNRLATNSPDIITVGLRSLITELYGL